MLAKALFPFDRILVYNFQKLFPGIMARIIVVGIIVLFAYIYKWIDGFRASKYYQEREREKIFHSVPAKSFPTYGAPDRPFYHVLLVQR